MKTGAFRSLLSSIRLANLCAVSPGSSAPGCPLYHLISFQSLRVLFLIRDNFTANLACCSRFSLTLIASGFISDISHVVSPHFLEDCWKNSSKRSSRPFQRPFRPTRSLPGAAGCHGEMVPYCSSQAGFLSPRGSGVTLRASRALKLGRASPAKPPSLGIAAALAFAKGSSRFPRFRAPLKAPARSRGCSRSALPFAAQRGRAWVLQGKGLLFGGDGSYSVAS